MCREVVESSLSPPINYVGICIYLSRSLSLSLFISPSLSLYIYPWFTKIDLSDCSSNRSVNIMLIHNQLKKEWEKTGRRFRETMRTDLEKWQRIRGFCRSEGIEAHVSDTSWDSEETLQPAAGALTAVLSPCGIITLCTLYRRDREVCLYA